MRQQKPSKPAISRRVAVWQSNVKHNFAMLRKDPLFQLRSCSNFAVMSISFVVLFYSDSLAVKLLSIGPYMVFSTLCLCVFDFDEPRRSGK